MQISDNIEWISEAVLNKKIRNIKQTKIMSWINNIKNRMFRYTIKK